MGHFVEGEKGPCPCGAWFALPEDMRDGLSRPHNFRDGIAAATVFSREESSINHPELAILWPQRLLR